MAGLDASLDLVRIGLYVGCRSGASPTHTNVGDRLRRPLINADGRNLRSDVTRSCIAAVLFRGAY
jgi:hypothetical protein